ncbi:ATP-binding protein [Streptomyces sp. NPDC006283]|uniref:ATP-binding protein n=1 Tax=Streptomyces sp. NPDC006283 TaxID=3156741 RepID=UPI0033B3EA20
MAVHQLDAWGAGYGTDMSETVAYIVAELVTNAVTHGREPGRDFELRLLLSDSGALRIEVSDTRSEPLPTTPPEPAPDAETGRGLLLVQALADADGVTPRPVGKTVWAALHLRTNDGQGEANPPGFQ